MSALTPARRRALEGARDGVLWRSGRPGSRWRPYRTDGVSVTRPAVASLAVDKLITLTRGADGPDDRWDITDAGRAALAGGTSDA